MGKKRKKNMINSSNEKYEVFFEEIYELLVMPEIQELEKIPHHIMTSRLQHCINVSYFSYTIAKKMGWNYQSAARGGLLHDLFYYDYSGMGPFAHSAHHPKVALENAKKITTVNALEEDIILKHMWLMTWDPPRYRESFLVTFVDKFSAAYEVTQGVVYSMLNVARGKMQVLLEKM